MSFVIARHQHKACRAQRRPAGGVCGHVAKRAAMTEGIENPDTTGGLST
jgi:hypothetical protein